MTENAQEKRSDEEDHTDPTSFSGAKVTGDSVKTDPIEVLGQLEGLVKGVDKMKESLRSGAASQFEPTLGTDPDLGTADDISAGQQPKKAGSSNSPGAGRGRGDAEISSLLQLDESISKSTLGFFSVARDGVA